MPHISLPEKTSEIVGLVMVSPETTPAGPSRALWQRITAFGKNSKAKEARKQMLPMPTSEKTLTQGAELASHPSEFNLGYYGWRVMIAASFGVMAGFGSLFVCTFAVFVKPLGAAFGRNREVVLRGLRNRCHDGGRPLTATRKVNWTGLQETAASNRRETKQHARITRRLGLGERIVHARNQM
jgi:hypothetical protein